MSEPLSEARLQEIREQIARAHKEIGEVASETPSSQFRMSVPANPERDTDLIVSAALTGADELAAEVDRLSRKLALYSSVSEIVDGDWQREVHRLKAQVADLSIRHDAQKRRADEAAARLRSLMRYAIRRTSELGMLRNAVHDEGDFTQAERLTFAIQEIKDAFKPEHASDLDWEALRDRIAAIHAPEIRGAFRRTDVLNAVMDAVRQAVAR